jgi:predicted permease
MSAFLNDIKYGFRQLLKSPGFTIAAVITLALCLGANLTIFAVVDAILLRPLPFPEPDRLVTMYNSYPNMDMNRVNSSYPNYYSRRDNIDAFSHIAALRYNTAIVGEPGSTESTDIMHVSPEFFATLGTNPAMGRSFTEEEMTHETDDVAILSNTYWHQYFNADPDVLGRSVRVNGVAKMIIGVLPSDFRYLSSKARIFLPLSTNFDQRKIENLHSANIELIARLKPGVSLLEAQLQIDTHNAALGQDLPFAKLVAESGFHTIVAPLRADHVANIRPTLLLVQAGVFLLLFIGGVNLVNLLLIRASGRTKELAIRQSLGASYRDVVRQVMVETVLLTLIGGLFGFTVGAAGIRLLDVLGVEQLPLGAHVVLDERLALVALLGAVIMGIVVGIPIAWFNLRSHLASALQSESRCGTTTLAVQRLRHGLVVTQIALAFVLLAGAGLLGLSLKHAMAVSPGFRVDHVLTGHISLPSEDYRDRTARLTFTDRLLEEVRQQPGILAAGQINAVPISGASRYNEDTVVTVVGHTLEPGIPPMVHCRYAVNGDYFAAMGIPLREGRFLEGFDSHRQNHVCVVDENFARHYWPQGDALGKRVFNGLREEQDLSEAFTVVGVVGAVKQKELTDAKANLSAIYFPYGHHYNNVNTFFLVVRTHLAPETLGLTLQKIVREIDPDLPVNDIRSMEVRISDSLVARRSPALLTGLFAVMALLLSAVGTYGVLSYAVAQRRREIGVRIALGAAPKQVGRQFLSLGLRLLVTGTILGVLGAWLAGRVMQSVLFDVPALHVSILVGTGFLMTIICLIACWIPARRAAKIDPMSALRYE